MLAMPRLGAVALICLLAAVVAASALSSRGHVAYRVMVNTRLRGGLLLQRGDRVVCRNPGRWLAVALPQPNADGVIRAVVQFTSGRTIVRLTVVKSVVTGRGTITCTRFVR